MKLINHHKLYLEEKKSLGDCRKFFFGIRILMKIVKNHAISRRYYIRLGKWTHTFILNLNVWTFNPICIVVL